MTSLLSHLYESCVDVVNLFILRKQILLINASQAYVYLIDRFGNEVVVDHYLFIVTTINHDILHHI